MSNSVIKPPCYVTIRDMNFIVKYLGLPNLLQQSLSRFARMENLNWKRNWPGIMASADFYIEKDLENFILFHEKANFDAHMKDRF